MSSMRMLFVLSAVLVVCRVHSQPRDVYTADDRFYRTEAGLTVVPSDIPRGAVFVNISANNIVMIQSRDFADMTALTFLELSINQISEIQSGSFSDLGSVLELLLNGNRLTVLEDDMFKGLSSLEKLVLSFNIINSVERYAFAGLRSLKELFLHTNELTELRANMFTALSTLENLVLTNNRINTIMDGSFSGLSSLKKLWLDSNDLAELRYGMFIGMPNLERLALQLNKLTSVKGGILTGLFKLQVLDLDENQITSVRSDSFRGLEYLREVWLWGNKLTTFDGGAFSGLPRPLDLTLGNNPLVCDSNLCWLKQGYVTWLPYQNRNLEPDCENSISWSTLSCAKQVDGCSDPGQVENAKRIGSGPFKVNSKVNYMCDFCYMGSKEITCQSNGQWSDLPVCREVECPEPGGIGNGKKLSSGPYTCSYLVAYECNPGYMLSGNALLVCRGDATWNAPKPQCVPIPSSNALPTCKTDLDDTRWLIIAIAAGVAGLFVAVICTATCMECCTRRRKVKKSKA